MHAAFQIAWALAMTIPAAAKMSELADRPSSSGALAIIEVTGIWALVAGAAWALRVVALTSSDRWGARTRQRIRESGRRRRAER